MLYSDLLQVYPLHQVTVYKLLRARTIGSDKRTVDLESLEHLHYKLDLLLWVKSPRLQRSKSEDQIRSGFYLHSHCNLDLMCAI